MAALAAACGGEGSIYLAGGATAVLHGWRPMTIDIDLKPDPEPPGLFEALAILKNELDLNVELACPTSYPRHSRLARTQPVHCATRSRQIFPLRSLRPGAIQAATPARPRPSRRSLAPAVRLDSKKPVVEMFQQIEPQLIRYPAIDPASFRAAVREFCDVHE